MRQTDERKWIEIDRGKRRDSGAITTIETYTGEWISFRVTCVDHGNTTTLEQRNLAFDRARKPSGWCSLCREDAAVRRRASATTISHTVPTDSCELCGKAKTGVSRIMQEGEADGRHLMICGSCLPTKKAQGMIERMFGPEREARRKEWRESGGAKRAGNFKPSKKHKAKPIDGLDEALFN